MKITSKNFINRFKKGKEDAFEYVIDEYIGIVKAVIYNSLKSYNDPQLVEECINDAFLGAWENAIQFKGDSEDFRKWICTIAKFKAVDKQRKLSKSQIVTDIEDTQMQTVQSAEDGIIKRESTQELLQILSQLEEIDRDIFTMKYFLDMKNEDIANHLGLSKAAIDNRLYRGKKKLRQLQLKGSLL
ncbi:sigma-70 family RNA polymerase sigma factor [Viridibacillus sp. YIM B01967]|uniref:Sigma-70 family RNA polymerase sigma factor n=1 Tax=Viridibacillus soli TaxID=2798301 RepID=A0ABS1H3D5_9BACL|nr:sigma-70 family RNA polymerase sigma factor [Viridibacillus soli]MBK3493916.1 sigma-70 family RNA polymerase sigma factor [Viridibacillus soli]